jgi:protein phosphatase
MSSNDFAVDAFGLTDVGRKREVNEDQFLIAELSESMLIQQTSLAHADHQRLTGGSQGKLFIVADGIGGHGGGDVASSVAVDAVLGYVLNIMPWFFRLNESQEDDLLDELKAALERCQKSVKRAAEGEAGHPRMGTTLTMAYVLWPRLYVVHVGDSRCYLGRGSDLEQITTDHTMAQQLVDQSVMSAETAEKTKWSSVLWNAIGGGKEELSPEVYRAQLERGDTLLLCTDGLSRYLDESTLSDRLTGKKSRAQSVAQDLVAMANEKGGADNITVVLARFL